MRFSQRAALIVAAATVAGFASTSFTNPGDENDDRNHNAFAGEFGHGE